MDREQGNDEQALLWNGTAGQGWVAAQDALDRLLRPFEPLLAAAVRPGDHVLDIGCGTGATTLAAARQAGPAGHCLGLDISEPMIAAAQARAAREAIAADFIVADAQSHGFMAAAFDLLISRFGVMFFADPVAAFANLRRAAGPDGRLRLIAWRGPEENPFMTAAERAAAPLLPELPPRAVDVPGQFGFAGSHRVRTILQQSGWENIAIRAIDTECAIPAETLDGYLEQVGPVARFLRAADAKKRAQLLARIHPAFDPYRQEGEIRFIAACWMIEAGPA